MNLLDYNLFNNGLREYSVAILVFVIALVTLKIFKAVIVHKMRKMSLATDNKFDDIVVKAIDQIHTPFYIFTSFYIALQFIIVPAVFSNIVFYVFLVSIIYYTVRFAEDLVEYGFSKIIENKEEKEKNVGIIRLLQTFVKVGLWIVAVITFLSNIGYNVNSLVAGLGIGGLAIALALQSILGDLFSAFSIYLDKPFEVGDFVIIGDKMGVIKSIGIKTTRLQALLGEEIVISNSELTSAQVRNFGKMEKRRIVFGIGVSYETKSDVLEKIPEYIKNIVENVENIKFDRAHLKDFGDSSLNYEIVYYVLSGDYNQYMDIQQSINFEIIRKFEKENIEIAYPTQTLYIKK